MTARSPTPGMPGQTGYSVTSPSYMRVPGTPGMNLIGQASPSYYRGANAGPYGSGTMGAAFTPYSPAPYNPMMSA